MRPRHSGPALPGGVAVPGDVRGAAGDLTTKPSIALPRRDNSGDNQRIVEAYKTDAFKHTAPKFKHTLEHIESR